MRRPLLFLFVSALVLPLFGLAGCEEAPPVVDAAALEGGDPLPEKAMTIVFPWMGKQSIMCIGDAVERQVAFVDFTDDALQDLVGTAKLAADGSGTATFTVPAVALRTGHEGRDEKLRGGGWLDVENHENLAFEATKIERVKPTVWKLDGTWTMHGVTKPASFLANVRYVGTMRNVGETVVRAKGSFTINLRDHEVGGDSVGSPAVAETWDVDVVLLGVMRTE